TLASVNPATGDLITLQNYYGNKVESSSIVDIKPYAGGDVLILENRGRSMYVSRVDASGNAKWERKIKYQNYYGHVAQELEVDNAGNIAVLSQGLVVFNENSDIESAGEGLLTILNGDGSITQQVRLNNVYGSQPDLYCDGQNFFVLHKEGGDYNVLFRINAD